KSKVILSGLLLLSMLLQTMPVYATILDNELSKEEVRVTKDSILEDNLQEEKLEVVEETPSEKVQVTADEITGTWGTCPWTFDPSTGRLIIEAGDLGEAADSPWNTGQIEPNEVLIITLNGEIIAPANSESLFGGNKFKTLGSLRSIENAGNLNVSKVTSMRSMFTGATVLKELDVSTWDTSNVNDMFAMFSYAYGLRQLDVSNWDTGKVTNMSQMFSETSIYSLDLTKWNTSSVTDMSDMFSYSRSIDNLDLSKWNTGNVTNMSGMFRVTENLTNLNISTWDTSNVEYMIAMFGGWQDSLSHYEGSSLKSLDLSNWNVSKVKSMYGMFDGCDRLESLDLSGWDTRNVAGMSFMFHNCDSLVYISLGKNFRFVGGTEVDLQIEESEKWLGEKTGNRYNTTENFVTKYDGTKPDTYIRLTKTEEVTLIGGNGALSDSINQQLKNFRLNRITGLNRYETSAKVAQEGHPVANDVGTVIIASGENYTDKLTATVLASVRRAPILLTKKDSLPESVLKEIERIDPREIIIIGGENTISKEIENKLADYTVERIAGINRYSTAVKIAEVIRSWSGGSATEVILVSGTDFPDAIAMTTKASKKMIPMLLTSPDSLSTETEEALKIWNLSKVTIGGGSASVSNEVEETVKNITPDVTRIAGANRYETSVKVAKSVYPNSKHIVVASGENFSDAIVGSAYASKKEVPIVLSAKNKIPSVVMDYINRY
ncbi:BspA family leucine-rich repeat surface protein, partial [Peptostreptococcaceae bacterium OttesenSCG-928-C18]|nr:BspA family leucine-rich repeat surface protein [Peptostreptococcaceae bacterium OttesenSCG-928-C18]